MIEAEAEKHYPSFTLSVKFKDEGTISIIGKNGSGKTTFLRIIAGLIKPDRGFVKINGLDITNLPINKRNVILVNQETYIPNLKIRKHLIWGAKLRNVKIDDKEVEEISKILGLPSENKKVSELSLGNKERVALATALLAKPKLILVDEGFSNINNKREFIRNYISLAKDFKIELIYVTQDIEDAKLGEKIYQMDNGTINLLENL